MRGRCSQAAARQRSLRRDARSLKPVCTCRAVSGLRHVWSVTTTTLDSPQIETTTLDNPQIETAP